MNDLNDFFGSSSNNTNSNTNNTSSNTGGFDFFSNMGNTNTNTQPAQTQSNNSNNFFDFSVGNTSNSNLNTQTNKTQAQDMNAFFGASTSNNSTQSGNKTQDLLSNLNNLNNSQNNSNTNNDMFNFTTQNKPQQNNSFGMNMNSGFGMNMNTGYGMNMGYGMPQQNSFGMNMGYGMPQQNSFGNPSMNNQSGGFNFYGGNTMSKPQPAQNNMFDFSVSNTGNTQKNKPVFNDEDFQEVTDNTVQPKKEEKKGGLSSLLDSGLVDLGSLKSSSNTQTEKTYGNSNANFNFY
ncbi:MAG: hypothetical protein MJ252_18500 [archaeon]|nr:hypothetical protein [archaeon]